MTQPDRPLIGVVEAPDLARSLALLGFEPVGGGEFRSAALAIRSLPATAPVPVVVRDVTKPGLRAWIDKQALSGSRVVILRGDAPGSVPAETGVSVTLPASINSILANAGWGPSAHPLGDALVAGDGSVDSLSLYEAIDEPQPVVEPEPEPVFEVQQPLPAPAPVFAVDPAPAPTPTAAPVVFDMTPVVEVPAISPAGVDASLPDWLSSEFEAPAAEAPAAPVLAEVLPPVVPEPTIQPQIVFDVPAPAVTPVPAPAVEPAAAPVPEDQAAALPEWAAAAAPLPEWAQTAVPTPAAPAPVEQGAPVAPQPVYETEPEPVYPEPLRPEDAAPDPFAFFENAVAEANRQAVPYPAYQQAATPVPAPEAIADPVQVPQPVAPQPTFAEPVAQPALNAQFPAPAEPQAYPVPPQPYIPAPVQQSPSLPVEPSPAAIPVAPAQQAFPQQGSPTPQTPVFQPEPVPVFQPQSPVPVFHADPQPQPPAVPTFRPDVEQTPQQPPQQTYPPVQQFPTQQAQQPVFAPQPQQPVFATPDQPARPHFDVDYTDPAFTHQAVDINDPSYVAPDMTKVVISFAGKGGVGKTKNAIGMASRAAEAGLRVALVDMNRGQGDVRTYLQLAKPDVPSILTAAYSGNVEDGVLDPDTLNTNRPRNLPPLGFAVVLAPPPSLADPRIVTTELYRETILFLTTKVDLVIVDTQIAEEVDTTGLIEELVIPLLRGGAWGLGISDKSTAGLRNLLERVKSFNTYGVSKDNLFVTVGRARTFTQQDAASMEALFGRQYATFAGAISEDPTFAEALDQGIVNLDGTGPRAVIDYVLRAVTGSPAFDAPASKKRSLFGRRK